MEFYPEKKYIKFTKGLVKHIEGPWYLLLLPNQQWAAFWYQGLETYYAESIFNGNYEEACAFIGNKKDTIEFILKELQKDNLHDPLNFNYQIEKIRKKLTRSNSKLHKFPD
jgi:hypothetical protein